MPIVLRLIELECETSSAATENASEVVEAKPGKVLPPQPNDPDVLFKTQRESYEPAINQEIESCECETGVRQAGIEEDSGLVPCQPASNTRSRLPRWPVRHWLG